MPSKKNYVLWFFIASLTCAPHVFANEQQQDTWDVVPSHRLTDATKHEQDNSDRGSSKAEKLCNLTVTGIAKLGTLFVCGDATINGNLRVRGIISGLNFPITFNTDLGTATPTLGVLNILGGTDITTTGSGNTVTIDFTGVSGANIFNTDAGAAVPVAGVLNVFGGSNITTTGAGNTITIAVSGSLANAYLQGGNSFGATGILGLNDAHDLTIRTDSTTRITITTDGAVSIAPPTAVGNDTLTVTANTTDTALVVIGDVGSAAQTITAAGTQAALDILNGNINLTNSTSANTGNITKAHARFIHNFGTNNTFTGINAGNFTMTGTDNAGFGFSTLTGNTTGLFNMAMGSRALLRNTIGDGNVGLGIVALNNNISGNFNMAIGGQSIPNNTTGVSNVGIGFDALFSNLSGSDNVAIGTQSMNNNNAGVQNVGIGTGALFSTGGDANVAIGWFAGPAFTSGAHNVLLGTQTGNNYTGAETNNICIGFQQSGVVGDNNTTRIGNSSTTRCFIAGIITAGPFANTVTIDPATGQLGGLVSSQRFKENIKTISTEKLRKLLLLRPTQFNYKNDIQKNEWYGFIAEEVEPLYPELISRDTQGNINSINYNCLIALLVGALQNQQKIIDHHNQRIQALENA